MYAGTTQALADQSLAVMDAVFTPFEAAWPKQLSVSNFSGVTSCNLCPFATFNLPECKPLVP